MRSRAASVSSTRACRSPCFNPVDVGRVCHVNAFDSVPGSLLAGNTFAAFVIFFPKYDKTLEL